ncbi:hypothetical protein BaRGS_00024917, partial [Batillaria attramentaria]
AHFYFPTLHDTTNQKVQENTTLSIEFGLDTSGCETHETDKRIIISKWHESSRTYGECCVLVLQDAKCKYTSSRDHLCGCLNGTDDYHFTKKVDRNDSTHWKWQTFDGTAKEHEIFLNVT